MWSWSRSLPKKPYPSSQGFTSPKKPPPESLHISPCTRSAGACATSCIKLTPTDREPISGLSLGQTPPSPRHRDPCLPSLPPPAREFPPPLPLFSAVISVSLPLLLPLEGYSDLCRPGDMIRYLGSRCVKRTIDEDTLVTAAQNCYTIDDDGDNVSST